MIQMRDSLGKVEYEAILLQIHTDLTKTVQQKRYLNILGDLQAKIMFVFLPFYFLRLTFCRARTRAIKSHEPPKLRPLIEERPEDLSSDDELVT